MVNNINYCLINYPNLDLLKTLDCVLVKKKKVKNITYQNHIDYNGLMSIDKYLKLLSGFEAFKSFFFNKINKFNFDSLADLYIFSGNFDFFRDIKNNPIDMNENLSEPDKKQKQLYQKFTCFLNKL